MPYSDILYLVSGNRTQGNAVAYLGTRAGSGVLSSGVIYRGLPVNYDAYVSGISGHFRTQIYVISGSGL